MRDIIKIVEGYYQIPSGFDRSKFFHGTNETLKTGEFFPKRNLVFLSNEGYVSSQYGSNVYCCYVRSEIKEIDFTDHNQIIVTPIIDHFQKEYPNLGKVIKAGKLWRDKTCEMKVIKYLLSLGYEKIEFLDELGENGGETRSFIIANPENNVFVFDQANQNDLRDEYADEYE